jgi:hypothetical protein
MTMKKKNFIDSHTNDLSVVCVPTDSSDVDFNFHSDVSSIHMLETDGQQSAIIHFQYGTILF